ncbi:MAG: PHP domain-containing protein [Micrococcales bacterium]
MSSINSFNVAADARIDLHAHTNRSDGTDSPAELVTNAHAAGLNWVAITDHDTTSGWAEAEHTARQLGIGLVPGIEVTTRGSRIREDGTVKGFSVHMLALLPDPNNQALAEALAISVAMRLERLKIITDRLSEDYDVVWEDVLEQISNGKTAGRPAIADAMVAKGIFEERTPFFGLVRPGTKYYEPTRGVPSTLEAIALIRGAGGVPILAHPMARGTGPGLGQPMPTNEFTELIHAGLGGFEIHHRDVDSHVADWLYKLSFEHGLIVTGSSDYHGDGKVNRLGENLTQPAMFERVLEQGVGTTVVAPA